MDIPTNNPKSQGEEIARGQQQQQLLAALRIARLAYWEYDVLNDKFLFNDQFYSLLRTTAEREGGYTMSSRRYAHRFVHPDDAAVVGVEIQKALATTDPNYTQQLDHRIIYAGGEVGFFNVNIRVEKDAQGRTIKTHGANMDITERKRMEKELRRTVSLLQSIFDSTADGLLVVDRAGKIVSFNERFVSLWKMPQEILDARDDNAALNHVLNQLKDPDVFVKKVRELYVDAEADSFDILEFKDGRVFERYSCPQRLDDVPIGRVWSFRDVTERKRAESRLKEAGTLLQTMLDNSPVYIYFKDLESRFVRVSRSLANSLQISDPERFKGKTDFDFFPQSHAEISFEDERRIIRTGQPLVDKQESAVLANGEKVWGLTTKLPWRDGTGAIVGTFGITRNITAIKEAEDKLTNERHLLRTLIDLLPETFHVKDLNSRFLMVNETLAKRFGKDNYSQVIGLSDVDFFPPDAAATYRAGEEKVLAGEPLIDHESMVSFPDGKSYLLMTTKVPFRDSQGRICGLVGIGRDITDRKRAEETIAHERHLLMTLIDLLPEFFYVKDMESRFLMANKAIVKSFGKEHYSQVLGLSDADLFPAELAATFRAEERKVLSGESLIDHEEIGAFPDGRNYMLLTSKVPFRDSHGRICGLVGIGRDITERKLLEEQFRQSQKMEAIGRLSGGIAHDFNNILTVIQGNASLMQNAQLKPEEKSECLNQIVRASERAADLTRQLLMFSRKQIMQPSNLNLNEVVGHATKMLQRILGEDITLQSNYAPDLPAIHADTGMVEQVLLNLVVNARDAMPSGGRLTIVTGVEMVDKKKTQQNPEAKAGLHVRLTVTDTGCGIAPEILHRIFEPFFTTKEVGKGTGLGLATVYGIIHQHHGWITVSSEVNKGTVFHIYFPALAGVSIPKKSAPVASQFAPGTETILVVEDEPPVRLLVINLLKRCGYNVLQAESGVAALKVWHEHKDEIQLLLTDIIMPDNMTGLELAERLKADKPKLKIIYTSGYSGEDSVKGVELVEEVNFLKKPYRTEKLTRLLRNVLDQK